MIRKTLLAILTLSLTLAAAEGRAQVLDFGFNDYSAQIRYDYPVSEDDYGRALLSGRLLYNDDEETTLGSLGINFAGEPGNVPGLELGVGAHGYGGRTDHGQDLAALGISGSVRYAPPTLEGFGMTVRGAYAPRIFTFADSERLVEGALRLSYAATPKIRLHLEYQNVRAKFEDRGTWTIDEGVRIGFEARF